MSDRAIKIETNRKVLEKALAEISRNVPKATKTGFKTWGTTTLGKFVGQRLAGRPGLKKRTGDLSRSFFFKTTGTMVDGNVVGSFYTRSKYAAIHEFGKTITPKKAKRLAVPVPNGPALTAAGVNKYKSPLRTTLPKSHHFFVHKADSGKLYLLGVDKNDADAEPVAWFRLQLSATIKPRMHLRKTISAERDNLINRLGDSCRGLFDG